MAGGVSQAFSEIRPVAISVTGSNIPLGAYKAVIDRVQEMEFQYNQDNSSVIDLTTQLTVLTGRTHLVIYVFNLTLDISAASYTFAFLEEAANVETATTSGVGDNA